VRFRGGSPKNMGQGQYWVRRNLDDQRRLAAAARRVDAERERAEKANARDAVRRQHADARQAKLDAVAKLQNARNRHFDHIQSQVATTIEALTRIEGVDGRLMIPVEEGSRVHEEMKSTMAAFNELAEALADESVSLTATRLAKHMVNTRRMFVAFGKGMGICTKWDPGDMVLYFGDRKLHFSEPT